MSDPRGAAVRRRGVLLSAVLMATAGAPLAHGQAVTTDYAAAPAGVYRLDPANSSVTLKLSHMGLSSYSLRLSGLKGSLTLDPAHVEASRLEIEAPAEGVDTGVPAFDRQIADEALEAQRFPAIRFVATSIKPGPDGRGQVTGDLTLHGQTRPATLDVIFNGFTPAGAGGTARLGFSADGAIRRSDFGVTRYAPIAGDAVSIAVEAEFTK